MSSAGSRSIMARATVRPPKPLSNTPMGRSSIGPTGYRPAAHLPSIPVLLAHGGLAAGADNVATLLVVAAIVVLAWWRIVWRRTRDGGRRGWLKILPALAGVLVLGAVVTPTFVRTTPSKKRPNSTARLEILSPAQGSSEPAKVRVRLALHGGKLAALDAPIP